MAQIALSTKISPALFDRLEQAAKESGNSKASIVEAALAEYLSKQASK